MTDAVPFNEGALKRTIYKMLLGFPAKERNRAATVECWAETLSRFPLKYVEEACDYVARGKLNGGRFMPTVGELAQLTEELQRREYRKLEPAAKREILAWPSRVHEEFDPKAETFSPYRLGMTKEEITARVDEFFATYPPQKTIPEG